MLGKPFKSDEAFYEILTVLIQERIKITLFYNGETSDRTLQTHYINITCLGNTGKTFVYLSKLTQIVHYNDSQ